MNNSLALMEGVVSGLERLVLMDARLKTDSVSVPPRQPLFPSFKTSYDGANKVSNAFSCTEGQ